MNIAYLLLGSNLGNREELLYQAITHIQSIGLITVQSSVYETEPWGLREQPAFLNQVVCVETSLNATQLLNKILGIEKKLGRTRKVKWAERKIDIDILYYNQDIIVKSNLKIPHSEIHNRKFTLAPLAEIAPSFKHPVLNLTNSELFKICTDESDVRRLTKTSKS